jgi:hypothetical protein
MTRLLCALVLVLFVANGSGHAASPAIPRIQAGVTYAKARVFLVQQGMVPTDLRDHGHCQERNQDVCAAYPELEECAVDGLRPCNFLWRTGQGASFIVTTTGEQVGDLKLSAVTAR